MAGMLEKLKAMGREKYGFPCTKIVEDEEGNQLKVATLDGKVVPPFGEKYFRRVRDLPVRDDDVFLCGYPKSGSHWTWEVLRMILSQTDDLSTIGKSQNFIEMISDEMLESQASPRVLNSHLWFDYLPKQVAEKKLKIVLTARNPKDTAVSFYNHHINLSEMYGYNGPFKYWFQMYLDGNVDYGDFVYSHLSWHETIRTNPGQPIFIAFYENMKEDLPREIRAMAKFLEVDLPEDKVQAIAKRAGFESMQKAYSEGPSTKLIRKGQVGDWK
ncbi:sulfotransferase 1A2, partial [Aplysia californica]|uniref:Sulfotransferase 1A2 n=1 Tax=Aplysia californica TaxID=6500 RepID=A0ABM0JWV2_APLCA